MKKRRLLALSLCLALPLTACGGRAGSQSASGSVTSAETSAEPQPVIPAAADELTLGFYSVEGLHPYTCDNAVNQLVTHLIYEPLFELDETFAPEPCLAESCSYSFKVQAKDGKKLSNAVMVDLSTYAEGCVLQKINPYSAKYSLTRFIQDSSEYDIPAMYITSFDDVGYLESDGFYFPDLYVEEITLKKGVMSQNVAGSLKKETITETQILHVGDTITTLGGQTVKIAQLRVTTNPNEVFENCIDYREAYTRIDDLDLYIETTIPGTGAPGPTMFVNWTRDWQQVY